MKLDNFHKVIAETPQSIKDEVKQELTNLDKLHSMKLSKECIEAIEKFTINHGNLYFREGCKLGATEALINQSIYEKADLISLEDTLGFAEWVEGSLFALTKERGWMSYVDPFDPTCLTTEQVFQLYKQSKTK